MIGKSIVVFTTHRQTRRQVARALQSAGSTAYFVERIEDLAIEIERHQPNLVILDADDDDAELVDKLLPGAASASSAHFSSPVILLSLSEDKSPLGRLVDRRDVSNLVAKH